MRGQDGSLNSQLNVYFKSSEGLDSWRSPPATENKKPPATASGHVKTDPEHSTASTQLSSTIYQAWDLQYIHRECSTALCGRKNWGFGGRNPEPQLPWLSLQDAGLFVSQPIGSFLYDIKRIKIMTTSQGTINMKSDDRIHVKNTRKCKKKRLAVRSSYCGVVTETKTITG